MSFYAQAAWIAVAGSSAVAWRHYQRQLVAAVPAASESLPVKRLKQRAPFMLVYRRAQPDRNEAVSRATISVGLA